MKWAVVENGIVTNVIWAAGKVFDNLVPVNGRPVAIGDRCRGEKFYRTVNGVETEVLTEMETVRKEADEMLAGIIEEIYEMDYSQIFEEE